MIALSLEMYLFTLIPYAAESLTREPDSVKFFPASGLTSYVYALSSIDPNIANPAKIILLFIFSP